MKLSDAALVLGGIAITGASAFLAMQAPAVWRGTVTPLVAGIMNAFNSDRRRIWVTRRSYAPFVLELNLLTTGMLGFASGDGASLPWLKRAGEALIILTVPAVLVHLTINAYNRPRWLVPPDLRDRPGWVARSQERRRRLAAGLPPTSHQVRVLDVQPEPGYPDPALPAFVAKCEDEDCAWSSEAVSQQEATAEERVRREAASHSDQVALGTHRIAAGPVE